MREKIEQMAKGIFEYDTPSILLSQNEIGVNIASGTIFTGSFNIKNTSDSVIKGLIYSSSNFLKVHTSSFMGVDNHIAYEINGLHLNPGENIKGIIGIVSNCGEVTLPFMITVEAPFFDSSLGKIKDLSTFTNLARKDYARAIQLFKSPSFEQTILQYEGKYKLWYKELVKSKNIYAALEEFLISVHKKLPVHIKVEKTAIIYECVNESIKDSIALIKDNWGYGEYTISTDATFISFITTNISTDNFIQNSYELEYILLPEKMRSGNNFGRIFIKTAEEVIVVEITCRSNKTSDNSNYTGSTLKNAQINLVHNYVDFRRNIIERNQYIEEGKRLIDTICNEDEELYVLYTLVRIHLLIISDEEEEARKELHIFLESNQEILKNNDIAYCGYEYLLALLQKDDETIHNSLITIRNIYNKDKSKWQIFWLLLHIDKKYDRNKILKLTEMKEQFKLGCTSPIFYYEAVTIYNEEPNLLYELGGFELAVLNWGLKIDYITHELATHFSYIAGKQKYYSELLFRCMVKTYEKYGLQDSLSAICSLLIKGQKRNHGNLKWFELGIKEQLRITELYEYYMYSIDDSHEFVWDEIILPQPVLLYFIYNSNLNDRKKALLYAYVIKNKEKNPAMYRAYYKKIELYVRKLMKAGHISRNLSILYQEFIEGEALTNEIKEALPNIMFRHEIQCSNPNIKGVCVIHEELKEPTYVPMTNGLAYVNIVTDNCEIVLIDYNDNRYVKGVFYTLYKLMPWEHYIHHFYDISVLSPNILINLFDKLHNYQTYGIQAVNLRQEILKLDGISHVYHRRNLLGLIFYFFDNYEKDALEVYLRALTINGLNTTERNRIIEIYIFRGMYEQAFNEVSQYGYEGIAINKLMKLCNYYISSGTEDRKGFIVKLSHYIFKCGKYNEDILNYLVSDYMGCTSDMFVIWDTAMAFEIQTTLLEERLLAQMLFTGSYIINSISVFLNYYKNGTNYKLIRAFLSYNGYKYLLSDRIINKELFDIMKRETAYEENPICLLALIKYYTTWELLTDDEIKFIDYNIHKFVSIGIILPFFTYYKNHITLPLQLLDKYFVEYRTNPSFRVKMYYRKEGIQTPHDFIEEEMHNMFMGIFVKEFVIFYDECIEYYISEEDHEHKVRNTESTTIKLEDDVITDDDTRYNHINAMITSMELHDENALEDSIRSYMKNKYLIEQLFKPI